MNLNVIGNYINDYKSIYVAYSGGIDSTALLYACFLLKEESKIKKLKIHKAPTRAIENQLVEIFGTKVKLKPAQVGGSIQITYFSDDDLERIIDLLQSL